eukprot:364943-Chlamydomonas_euryale.AAC.34
MDCCAVPARADAPQRTCTACCVCACCAACCCERAGSLAAPRGVLIYLCGRPKPLGHLGYWECGVCGQCDQKVHCSWNSICYACSACRHLGAYKCGAGTRFKGMLAGCPGVQSQGSQRSKRGWQGRGSPTPGFKPGWQGRPGRGVCNACPSTAFPHLASTAHISQAQPPTATNNSARRCKAVQVEDLVSTQSTTFLGANPVTSRWRGSCTPSISHSPWSPRFHTCHHPFTRRRYTIRNIAQYDQCNQCLVDKSSTEAAGANNDVAGCDMWCAWHTHPAPCIQSSVVIDTCDPVHVFHARPG